MQLPEFLTQAQDGEIRLSGHRIGLYHLVLHYNEGESAEMLACRYPTVPLALVHKVLAFYLDNQAEVDAYVASCSAKMDEERQGAQPFDWDALRRRLESQQPPVPEAQVG
ncbi:MAG: DUF433 domain-containing protein [Pirellulales bacterium]